MHCFSGVVGALQSCSCSSAQEHWCEASLHLWEGPRVYGWSVVGRMLLACAAHTHG